jgi:hypothetical protein
MSEPDLTTVFPAENITIDADGLRRHLTLYLIALGGCYKKLLTKQAKLMCREMLDYTLPVEDSMGPGKGTSKAAQLHGMEVVKGQIEHLFKPLSGAKYGDIARNNDYGVFAMFIGDRKRDNLPVPHWLEGDISVGEFQRFQRAFIDDDQPGMLDTGGLNFEYARGGEATIEMLHKQHRGGPADYDTRGASESYFITDYTRNLSGYIRSAQKRVGRLKAGWYSTSVLLGDTWKAPAWIVGNQWGTGGVYDELDNKTQPAITVENKKHYRMSKSPGAKGFQSALNRRGYAIRNDIIRTMIYRGQSLQLLELAKRAENADLFIVTEAPF